jgi:hypothetical protein
MAYALRVWLKLDDRERAEVEKLERLPQRLAALRKMGTRKSIYPRGFPDKAEDTLVDQLAEDERVKAAFGGWVAKREKKAEKAEPAKGGGSRRLDNPLHQLAESLYFAQHPPERVSPANLALFEAQIPSWLRANLDPLPSDDAKRRLEILYRQIYPAGQEIPPPPKPEPASKTKAAARPAERTPALVPVPKPATLPPTTPEPGAPF